MKKRSPSGGLEPPTFRLTVERASQLRHEGLAEFNFHEHAFFRFFQNNNVFDHKRRFLIKSCVE